MKPARRPYRPTLALQLPTARGRAIRRAFWLERTVAPAIFGAVALYILLRCLGAVE